MLTPELIELINKDRKACLELEATLEPCPHGFYHHIYKDRNKIGELETASYKDNILTLFRAVIHKAYRHIDLQDIELRFNFGTDSYSVNNVSFKPARIGIIPGGALLYMERESLPINN